MKAVLDACVLVPTVLREVLVGAAARGAFVPVWSERLLGEWRRAAAKLGPDAARIAGVEAALLAADWPGAAVAAGTASLELPDADDRHVVGTALAAGAEVIVTVNLRDFPRGVLAQAGLRAEHPDAFLLGLEREAVRASVAQAQARAVAAGGDITTRALLKRAGLPRLARVAVSVNNS